MLDLDPAEIVEKGRLQPGNMLVVDTERQSVLRGADIKAELAAEQPYARWLGAGFTSLPSTRKAATSASLSSGPVTTNGDRPNNDHLLRAQRTFGYTQEELHLLLEPMARAGQEPLGSMGSDTPIAVLSRRPRMLYDYFTQLFAQVTNPPLDALREELVTSTVSLIGPDANVLTAGPEHCRKLALTSPIIDDTALARISAWAEGEQGEHMSAAPTEAAPTSTHIVGRYLVGAGAEGLRSQLERICDEASARVAAGARVIVLSDRGPNPGSGPNRDWAPIPSLLLVAAVRHHLVREGTGALVSLVLESGDCRTVHHAALLLGYGAAALNPYLARATVAEVARSGRLEGMSPGQAVENYHKALNKGIVKVMSKMGISTVASYRGAQVFEATGLDGALVSQYFPHTPSRIGGVKLDVIAAEVAARHHAAWSENPATWAHRELDVGGEYQWRREGEVHLFNPETVFLLQHATRTKQFDVFRQYTSKVNKLAQDNGSLRGLFRFHAGGRSPVPLEEVEPVADIVRRFVTGAMSYGSISIEAHQTLAIAMNRLGGRSNTGEGGEDPERLYDPALRSAIKQVASARFGVTSEYLVNADELQIKIAQGAKPGEGGQLPGNKVWPWIARTRYATPGVGLISPPPHHDIYSIEDLAQLIYDLKNANDAAQVSVKLVSETGVGTVAAGVAKARADGVLISGHDGGTGASPLSSVKHAGVPWELGLADTQQTLMRNRLRDRITVQVDGQLKTGRDVVVAALLGAEEYGFSTAPLIVSGCVMMRVCHLDTCPVGIATQNPELRKRFAGTPEFVESFFRYIAEEVREHLAALGFRGLEEAIGRVDALDVRPAIEHWKAAGLNLAPILAVPESVPGAARTKIREQDHRLSSGLDTRLMELAELALSRAERVRRSLDVRNTHRTIGTRLGSEVTRRYGGTGLPDDTIDFTLHGTAGQSMGAFLPRGITLRLFGDTNDYLGKGLSGGRLILRPDERARFAAEKAVIAGNTVLYGATSGELWCRGLAGERFAVRNSGATAVVEGIGEHGCEYMTGGTVLVLGPVGRNFAAGMSGGVAYVYRLTAQHVNHELVELCPLSDADAKTVHTLLGQHKDETGSVLATAMLAEWPRARQRFTQIMPREYRRVRSVMAAAEEAGQDVDTAVMEVISHG